MSGRPRLIPLFSYRLSVEGGTSPTPYLDFRSARTFPLSGIILCKVDVGSRTAREDCSLLMKNHLRVEKSSRFKGESSWISFII